MASTMRVPGDRLSQGACVVRTRDRMIEISVIIPVRNEERYIGSCLESIVRNDYPKETLEIIVVDGCSDDSTRAIVEELTREHPYIRMLENPDRTVPYAMNIGIDASRGDLLMRMDAHTLYPPDYIRKLVGWHRRLEADNVGAVCNTGVLHETRTSVALRKIMSDPLGVGNSYFRTGVTAVKRVDTVPFGCYRRSVFERIGKYDTRLTRNQDIELNKRLVRNGGRIFLVPDVRCTYLVRETYREFARGRFATGRWIVRTSYLTRSLSSVSARHFVPLVFLLSLIVPAVLALVHPGFLLLSGLSLASYAAIVTWRSVSLSDRSTSVLHLLGAFAAAHFGYGLGSLAGLKDVLQLACSRSGGPPSAATDTEDPDGGRLSGR